MPASLGVGVGEDDGARAGVEEQRHARAIDRCCDEEVPVIAAVEGRRAVLGIDDRGGRRELAEDSCGHAP